MTQTLFPGNFLSSGEEYLPGENAFEDFEGNICSSAVGVAEFDREQMVVNIKSKASELKLVDVGTIVFGRVEEVRDSKLFVGVFTAENNGVSRALNGVRATLPVFNVKNEYVDRLSDLFKIGDIVKARVCEVTPFNVLLETKSSPVFGVVKGFCAKCRVPLHMVHNGFKCPKCVMSAERKFSSDYLVK